MPVIGLASGSDTAGVFLPGCKMSGYIIARVTSNLKIWSACIETMCYWLQETPACFSALPRICLSNNGGSEAGILGFSVVNNECCTSCQQTLKPSVLRCRRKEKKKRNRRTHPPCMHLSGSSSLNSSLQISKKVTLSSFLAGSLHPATKQDYWP